ELDHHSPAEPSAGARSRSDPHLPRGGGRARATGPPLLRRQGLDRPPAAGGEGVPARPAALPADARRHGSQLRRGHRVPRPPCRRARRRDDRRLRAGVHRHRTGPRGDRAAGVAQSPADRDAARRDREALVRRRLRWCPPRRGAGAGQGAHLLLPRRLRPVGSAPSAPRAVGRLQRPHPPRRARARLPAVELDRARRLGVHPRRGPGTALDLLRPRARGVPARRDALRRLAAHGADRRRGDVQDLRPLPHRGRHELHGRRALERLDARRRGGRDRRDAHHRARRDPRRRPGQRGRHGRPQARGLLL
ncbi:MAG: Sulfate adenylyltransferase subunit 2, partial [uncultured Solirubrobacteraceae bacterium]